MNSDTFEKLLRSIEEDLRAGKNLSRTIKDEKDLDRYFKELR